jgi:hypothetical protein
VHPSVPSMAERQKMSIMLSRVGPGTERGHATMLGASPKNDLAMIKRVVSSFGCSQHKGKGKCF